MYHMSLLKLSEMIKGRNEILSVPVFNKETKVEAREYFSRERSIFGFFCLKAAKNVARYSNLIFVTLL